MSIAEMQACLARLYVDEPFRKLFFIDPAATAESYRLTSEERAALAGLDHTALEIFAGSLRNKRRGRIERAYPLLFALDATEVQRYYSRYCQLYTAKPRQSGYQDVLDFGTFVEESLERADHLPPYTSALVRYERLYYAAALLPASPVAGETDKLDSDGRAAGTGGEARPRLRDGVTIADFDYDVAKIEDALAQDAKSGAESFSPDSCSIVFLPTAGTSGVKLLRVNAATKSVIDACDGRNTVPQVVCETESSLGAAGLHDSVVDTINRLLQLQVLALESATGSTYSPHRSFGTSETESM